MAFILLQVVKLVNGVLSWKRLKTLCINGGDLNNLLSTLKLAQIASFLS